MVAALESVSEDFGHVLRGSPAWREPRAIRRRARRARSLRRDRLGGARAAPGALAGADPSSALRRSQPVAGRSAGARPNRWPQLDGGLLLAEPPGPARNRGPARELCRVVLPAPGVVRVRRGGARAAARPLAVSGPARGGRRDRLLPGPARRALR